MRVHCSLLQVFPLSLERAREATPSPSWPGPRGDALRSLTISSEDLTLPGSQRLGG